MREMTLELAPDEVRAPKRPAARRPAAEPETRKGPGPSKLSYRLERALAKPMLRNAALVYLPLVLLAVIGWRVAADDGMRQAIEEKLASLVAGVAARPEFAVKGVEVTGGTAAVTAAVRSTVGVVSGMSSLTLDVEDLRRRIEALGVIRSATVQFDPQGKLRIAVVQRIEVVLYRKSDDSLVLLDREGVEIGPAGARADYPDLPVIRGEGAQERVGEVLQLLEAAADIVPRLRALIRVGGRRWDMVLDHGLTIKLPAEDPVATLSRVMALHYGEELLDRGLSVIDMRLPGRPALRMSPAAAETYQIRKAIDAIGGKDT